MWQHVCLMLLLGLFQCPLEMRPEHQEGQIKAWLVQLSIFNQKAVKVNAFSSATMLHQYHNRNQNVVNSKKKQKKNIHYCTFCLQNLLCAWHFWTSTLYTEWVLTNTATTVCSRWPLSMLTPMSHTHSWTGEVYRDRAALCITRVL